MATTMAGYAAVRIPVHNLRRHLLSPSIKTLSTFIASKPSSLAPGDWILSQTATGTATSGPPTGGPPAAVFRYIPAGRFWTLQGIEAAIFLTLSAALVALAVWWIRHRIA